MFSSQSYLFGQQITQTGIITRVLDCNILYSIYCCQIRYSLRLTEGEPWCLLTPKTYQDGWMMSGL